MRIGFVGGREFDAEALLGQLTSLSPADSVTVGSGIGAEKFVREQAPEVLLSLQVPPLRPDLYGKDALIIQVGDVLLNSDKVVLVGKGTRVKRARDILKRTNDWRLEENRREVVSI